MRKVTRIIVKSLMYLAIVILLLLTTLFFLIQTSSFQTWLAQKASIYLTEELRTKIEVDKVEIHFFKQAKLKGVFIEDLNKDTLVHGDEIIIDFSEIDYKSKKIAISNLSLTKLTAKLNIQKNDSDFNYQFIVDYFSSGAKPKDTLHDGWDVKLNAVTLSQINFQYRDNNQNGQISSTINFNNIRANNISGKLSHIKLHGDTTEVKISDLALTEQSGFKINNLNTYLKVNSRELLCQNLALNTRASSIKGFVNFKYSSWADYSDFLNKIEMDVMLEDSSRVHLKDIAAFTEELNGLNDTVSFSGIIKGYVSDLSLQQINLQIKKRTAFIGDISIIGLPDLKSSYIHLNAERLNTHYSDLIKFPNYPFTDNKNLEVPLVVNSFGDINYVGKFDGLLNDFNIYGQLKTALGTIVSDIGIKMGDKPDDVRYHGKIKTKAFNLSKISSVAGLSNLSANLSLKGTGITLAAIDAVLEGNISTLNYNNYTYTNLKIDGSFNNKTFNGILICTDPNADFDFNGSINFAKKMPQMDFISTINNLNLQKLNFTNQPTEISTQVLITLSGDNLNNLTGNINFDNTFYKNEDKTYKISTFDLTLNQEEILKKIHLTSNYFNTDMEGVFDLNTIGNSFRQTLNSYYPAFVLKNKGKTIYKDEFKFKVRIKKFDIINELFVNALKVSPNTQITGDFNALQNLFNFNLSSDLIEVAGIKFNDNKIESYSKNNKINLVFKGRNIQLTDSVVLDNYFMYLVSKDLETKYNLEWDNRKLPNSSGKIAGKVSFENNLATFIYDHFNIKAQDSIWQIVTSNPSYVDSSGTIIINPLKFKNGIQTIDVAGKISKKETDSLNIITSGLVLEQFNPILSPFNLKMAGELNGNITFREVNEHITLNSYLDFSKFIFNDNLIGELILKSNYIAQEKRLALFGYTTLGLTNMFGATIKNISFIGNYYLDKKEESIDLSVDANPLNLKLLNPLLEDILTIKNGFVKGKVKIHGTPENLLLDGNLNLFKSEILVDFSNVTYNMTGNIEIMPDQIRFSDILLKELNSKSVSQGTLNGNIFHTNFKRMQLDYDLTYRNMLVLNTTAKENKDYYGKIYGSGNIGIWGFLNNIYMQVRDTVKKNSKFILPLDGPTEIAENNFIKFVKKDTVAKEVEKQITGFNLDLNIVATPELTASIIFDKTNNDAINVFGEGEIRMKINTLGKFDMEGSYIITGGDYNFSLEKVITKKFDIDPGSSIVWSGNPYNAEIDVTASYRQRASIAPLINDVNVSKSRTPVACKLIMTDKLMSPHVNFALEFPSINDNLRSQITSVLADEQELNRQVFSFLLFRSFVPPVIFNATGGGVTAGNAAASTGSEFLSGRLSNVLDGMVGNFAKDLQVGVNYIPGSTTNSEEVIMNVNKNFLDDKLSVDGNFGVNNNRGGDRNLIGDVNVEYKLSEDGRYKLKGFNRTNNNTQVITNGGLYTQGVGFFYREEFNTFNELYNRYLSKIKKTTKNEK